MREFIINKISDALLINPEDINDYDLLDDYRADSLDFANIVIDLEDEFGIHFSPDDLERMRFYRVGQLIKFIENKYNSKNNFK